MSTTASGVNVTSHGGTKEASVILSTAETLLRPTRTPQRGGGHPLDPDPTRTAGDGKKAVYGSVGFGSGAF